MNDNLISSNIPDEDLDAVLKELEGLSVQTTADYTCTSPSGKEHYKQMAFHCSDKRIRLLSGGNRSGKTEGGVAEDVMHMTGIYPSWWPEALRYKHPTRGRIIVTDYKAGAAVFEEKLWKWLPRNLVMDISRTQAKTIGSLKVKHVSGGISSVEILTHEQDDMVFEGWSGHWAHFDEPPPREKYIATRRGLIDLKGKCWMTLTPINQPWIYDEIISSDNPDVFFTIVDTRDNPFQSEEEIASFERSLSDDEKEQRLHGNSVRMVGLVYKQFDQAVHVIPASRIPIDPRWPTYFVTDPHDRKPHFGIWAKVDPFGKIYVIGEIKFKGTFAEYSKEVLMREVMEDEWHIRPMDVIRILDPNKGNTPSAVSGLTLVNEFSNHGLFFNATVNDDITTGHLAVAGRLSYRKDLPLSSTNCPKLYFFKENTLECVRYMMRYTWSEWKGSGKDERSKKETPTEKFKDFPDCVRYLVMSGPSYFEQDDSDPEPYTAGGVTGYGPRQ